MVRVATRGKGEMPDWGIVTPTAGSTRAHGVMAGRALVDPKSRLIPFPVINPGNRAVNLPIETELGLLHPVHVVGDPLMTVADLDPDPTQGQTDQARDQTKVKPSCDRENTGH